MQENSCLKLPQMSENSGVENNKQLNIYYSFNQQMSLSKSKFWYYNNCLHFSK
jgi:hypothetical protein